MDKKYDIKDLDYIKHYLGFEPQWCDIYFTQWLPHIKEAVEEAKKLGCDYILESDYSIYDDGEFIKNMNGIVLFSK